MYKWKRIFDSFRTCAFSIRNYPSKVRLQTYPCPLQINSFWNEINYTLDYMRNRIMSLNNKQYLNEAVY